jgi:hypothetical protein
MCRWSSVGQAVEIFDCGGQCHQRHHVDHRQYRGAAKPDDAQIFQARIPRNYSSDPFPSPAPADRDNPGVLPD